MSVAIGEVVDNVIIDVENEFCRLSESAALPMAEQRSMLEVNFSASNEIRFSVVFAVIIVLVFVTFHSLQGLEGKFFRPLEIFFIN